MPTNKRGLTPTPEDDPKRPASEVEKLRQQLSKRDKHLAARDEQIARLQADLDRQTTMMTTLVATVEALQASIATLSARLGVAAAPSPPPTRLPLGRQAPPTPPAKPPAAVPLPPQPAPSMPQEAAPVNSDMIALQTTWAQVTRHHRPPSKVIQTALQSTSPASCAAALQRRPTTAAGARTPAVDCLVISPRLNDKALQTPTDSITLLVTACTGTRPLLVLPVGRLATTAEIYVDARTADHARDRLLQAGLLVNARPVPDRAVPRLAALFARAYFPLLRGAVLHRAGPLAEAVLNAVLNNPSKNPVHAARLRLRVHEAR